MGFILHTYIWRDLRMHNWLLAHFKYQNKVNCKRGTDFDGSSIWRQSNFWFGKCGFVWESVDFPVGRCREGEFAASIPQPFLGLKMWAPFGEPNSFSTEREWTSKSIQSDWGKGRGRRSEKKNAKRVEYVHGNDESDFLKKEKTNRKFEVGIYC